MIRSCCDLKSKFHIACSRPILWVTFACFCLLTCNPCMFCRKVRMARTAVLTAEQGPHSYIPHQRGRSVTHATSIGGKKKCSLEFWKCQIISGMGHLHTWTLTYLSSGLFQHVGFYLGNYWNPISDDTSFLGKLLGFFFSSLTIFSTHYVLTELLSG